jgi:hypothetical protein
MSLDSEIFSGKTLSDMFADVYKNTDAKRSQINQFVTSYLKMIKTPDDAAALGPIIKEFLEANIKNDEHIVRLVQIAQRLVAVNSKATNDTLLTEEEKQQLLKNVKRDFENMVAEQEDIEDTIMGFSK